MEEALRALIVELEGTPLKGIPFGQRILRMQSDQGTEWLNKTVIFAQGKDDLSNYYSRKGSTSKRDSRVVCWKIENFEQAYVRRSTFGREALANGY